MTTYDDIIGALTTKYDIEPDKAHCAALILANNPCAVIAASGKIGSGKDSTVEGVLDALGIADKAEHIYFTAPLKVEVTKIVNLIKEKHYTLINNGYATTYPDSLVDTLVNEMNINESEARHMLDAIYVESLAAGPYDGWTRTENMRRALQFWGTEVRRSQDANYWVKQAAKSIVDTIIAGDFVYTTDSRFPNEMEMLNDINAFSMRLNISPEEQSRRILSRDGIQVSEESRRHASEVSLDNYNNFSISLNTDRIPFNSVVNIMVSTINSITRNS